MSGPRTEPQDRTSGCSTAKTESPCFPARTLRPRRQFGGAGSGAPLVPSFACGTFHFRNCAGCSNLVLWQPREYHLLKTRHLLASFRKIRARAKRSEPAFSSLKAWRSGLRRLDSVRIGPRPSSRAWLCFVWHKLYVLRFFRVSTVFQCGVFICPSPRLHFIEALLRLTSNPHVRGFIPMV